MRFAEESATIYTIPPNLPLIREASMVEPNIVLQIASHDNSRDYNSSYDYDDYEEDF